MAGAISQNISMDDLSSRQNVQRPPRASQDTLESYAGPQDEDPAEDESQNEDDQESLPLAVRVEANRDLSWVDVAALIINKMVGTGIFTGPYASLLYTPNKNTVIVLWLMGFVFTVTSMLLYLEYARDLPYTGGELVYLDHVISRPRLRLFAYTMYAFYFVFVYTSCTNALRFARSVLVAVDRRNLEYDHIDENALRLIAVCIITVICLLLYFSTSKSQLMNKATASLKILLLCVVVIAGGIYISKNGAASDITISAADVDIKGSENNWTKTFLIILFSYHGWENATLVAGEIPRYNTLRVGFIVGVFVVGMFYLVIISIYCFAFPWQQIDNLGQDYLPTFLGGSDRAQVAAAIIIAFSAAGSMISVAYTCVRVKQTIGWTGILPWSAILRRSAPIRQKWSEPSIVHNAYGQVDNRPVLRKGTPEGGILLHWLMTFFYICISGAIHPLDTAISVTGQLLVYGHFFVSVCVGPAYLWFKPGTAGRCPAPLWNAPKPPMWMYGGLTSWIAKALLGGVPFAFAVVIIVVQPINPENRYTLYVMIGVLTAGALYWMLFVSPHVSSVTYDSAGFALAKHTHGVDDINDLNRRCDMCEDYHPPEAHRHAQEGYLSYNKPIVKDRSMLGSFLYRFFGGSNAAVYPDMRLDVLDVGRLTRRRGTRRQTA